MPGHDPYGARSASPPIDSSRQTDPPAGGLGAPLSASPAHVAPEVRNGAQRPQEAPIRGDQPEVPVAYQSTPAGLLALVRAAGDVRGLEVQRAYSPDGETWPADPATLDWHGVQGVTAGDGETLSDEHVLGLVGDDYQPDPDGLGDPIFRLVAFLAGGDPDATPARPLFYGYTLPLAAASDEPAEPAALTGDASAEAVGPQAGDDPGDEFHRDAAEVMVPLEDVPETAADVVAWVREHPLGSVLRHARATAAAAAESARPESRQSVDEVIVSTLSHPVDVEEAGGDPLA